MTEDQALGILGATLIVALYFILRLVRKLFSILFKRTPDKIVWVATYRFRFVNNDGEATRIYYAKLYRRNGKPSVNYTALDQDYKTHSFYHTVIQPWLDTGNDEYLEYLDSAVYNYEYWGENLPKAPEEKSKDEQ